MSILCLLWLILLQSVSTEGQSSQITVSGSSGTTLQHVGSNPSEVHIAAEGDDSEQNLLIHIRHKKKESKLSPQDMQQAEHITNIASSLPKSTPKHCQREIDEMNSAKREKNEIAIRLAALELQLQELEKANHLLQTQIHSKPNSIKHPIEVPIIIGGSDQTHYSPKTHTVDASAHKKHKTIEDTISTIGESVQKNNKGSEQQDDDEEKSEINQTMQKKNDKKEVKSSWNKWLIMLFIILLLIPCLVGIIFCFVSRKNNDTNTQNATFIVGDIGKKEHKEEINRDLPFVLNEPNVPMDSNHYSKESTKNDIQRLGANMNEYFVPSPKPVISSERVENDNAPNPTLSSTKNRSAHRMSLVDQQIPSDEN